MLIVIILRHHREETAWQRCPQGDQKKSHYQRKKMADDILPRAIESGLVFCELLKIHILFN